MKISRHIALMALAIGISGCSEPVPEEVQNNLKASLVASGACSNVLDVTNNVLTNTPAKFKEAMHKVFLCQIDYTFKEQDREANIIFSVLSSSKSFDDAKKENNEDYKRKKHHEIYKGKGFYLTDSGVNGIMRNDIVTVFGESKSANVMWGGSYNDSREKTDMVLLKKIEQLSEVVSKL